VDGVPETEVLGQLVSGGYHAGLGVSAVLGRPLTEDDDRLAATPVAVISWRYWQRRFGGDPSVIGKTVQVNRVPTVVVGVTPRGLRARCTVGESADVTVPLALHARFQPDRGANRSQPWYWWLRVMGRLAPGRRGAGQRRPRADPAGDGARRLARQPVARRRHRGPDAGRPDPGRRPRWPGRQEPPPVPPSRWDC
jgi:hypothetical protein